MAKFLLLMDYGPATNCDIPMDQWAPEDIAAHIDFQRAWARSSPPAASSSTRRAWPRRIRRDRGSDGALGAGRDRRAVPGGQGVPRRLLGGRRRRSSARVEIAAQALGRARARRRADRQPIEVRQVMSAPDVDV